MAIVTYILLAALYAGLEKRFNPEILGVTCSKAFGVILVDFFVIRFGCYILAISGQGQIVNIFAYSGYKFEGRVKCLSLSLYAHSFYDFSIVVLSLASMLGLKGILCWR